MAQAPQQQQQSQSGGSDNSLAAFWIIVLIVATGWITWKLGHAYIVQFVFAVKLLQAKIVLFFTDQIDDVILYMQTTDPAEVSFNMLMQASTYVGSFTRYPVILVLAVSAVVLYFSNITLRFRKTYSMQSLREQEQKNWPQIMPVVPLNLLDQKLDQGRWAMSMSPLEFCNKHGLLKRNELASLRSSKASEIVTAGLRRGSAKQIFALQLGPYWQGLDTLPQYMVALFAVFVAKIKHDRDAVVQLLQQMSLSATSGKINFSGARALAERHYNTKEVQKIVQKHAYVLTVMASLIEEARKDGVLPTAEFLWLKPLDRRLWYMLSTVGRQTPFLEVAGPYAHWMVEKQLNHKILVPMVDEAVRGLEVAIKEVKLTPEKLQELL